LVDWQVNLRKKVKKSKKRKSKEEEEEEEKNVCIIPQAATRKKKMQEGIIISICIEEIMAGAEQFDWLREIMKKTLGIHLNTNEIHSLKNTLVHQ
jgi:hypothetical protein